MQPANRLIWTNDNLVALQTLLEERDLQTRDYRYRGKIDLVYIDPPFMVNNDFRADNTIDIELDEAAHVQAHKEPSLVEIIAYRDTWRRGLDSFLSMLRSRLILLKQLLAPTGSIYVHLDSHAVHYVKVLMDEIFGYENFQNEIVWKRTSAHNFKTKGYVRSSDTILFYTQGDGFYFHTLFTEYSDAQMGRYDRDENGRLYKAENLTFSSKSKTRQDEWRGTRPPPNRVWGASLEERERLWAEGRILRKKDGSPRLDGLKIYIEETKGNPLSTVWSDIDRVGNTSIERLGYPTQKPIELLSRIISVSCPPGGLVLDCFVGSGTTAEAAERLGRSWIGVDNGKYAVHLTRKRLIHLHGQPRPPETARYRYDQCEACGRIERREAQQKSSGQFQVRPFTVENMGVYQRAAEWQGFQQHRTVYRDEMIRVFGGEPVEQSPLLHGRKGSNWVHVGPLDAPVSSIQVWSIAREAQRTSMHSVTILSADFDTLSASEKEDVKKKTGVNVTIRVIPSSAIDEVKRRLDLLHANPDTGIESTTIPAFYAPLSIVLEESVSGRSVSLRLKRCEVDIESFIASQRPMLKPVTDKMSANARKKAGDELERWAARERDLKEWLDKARSWQAFVDFWAVDWNYGRQVGDDGKPIFVTEWQSFRARGDSNSSLTFDAKFAYAEAGAYRIAARVTDVFGNDGIATVEVSVER